MSIEATAWALGVKGVPDPTARVILIGLANHAAHDGTAAWPSVATLAEYAVCSERTVHRRLRELEDMGLIRKGEQQLVQHLPSNRRPVVYNLPVGMTDWQASRGDRLAGVTPEASRGVTPGNPGVTRVADKPSLEPSMNHPSPQSPPGGGGQGVLTVPAEEPARTPGFVYPDAFEALWAVWPKRRTDSAGKKAAHTSWHRAVNGTTKRKPRAAAEQLQAAVERMASDPNLPPEGYQPNLTTWLNNDRWLNGPYAPRAGTSSRPEAGDSHRAMHQSHDAANIYRQLEQSGYYDPPADPRPPIQITRRTA